MARLAMCGRLVVLAALALQAGQVAAQATPAQEDLPKMMVSSLGYDDLQEELTVSPHSTYCNWKPVMGPICVYNKTDQVRLTVLHFKEEGKSVLCSFKGVRL